MQLCCILFYHFIYKAYCYKRSLATHLQKYLLWSTFGGTFSKYPLHSLKSIVFEIRWPKICEVFCFIDAFFKTLSSTVNFLMQSLWSFNAITGFWLEIMSRNEQIVWLRCICTWSTTLFKRRLATKWQFLFFSNMKRSQFFIDTSEKGTKLPTSRINAKNLYVTFSYISIHQKQTENSLQS